MSFKLQPISKDEVQLLIDKISTMYRKHDAEDLSNYLKYYFDDESNQIKIVKFQGGFAYLETNASIMMQGTVYLLQNEDFFKIKTSVYEDTKFDSDAYVFSIKKNGVNSINTADDESLYKFSNEILKFFIKK